MCGKSIHVSVYPPFRWMIHSDPNCDANTLLWFVELSWLVSLCQQCSAMWSLLSRFDTWLHTPDLHSSNLSQPTRAVCTVTSFGPVIATAPLLWFTRTLSIPASAAISVRSNDVSSRSESFRRRCRSSAAFPFTPSSECVNSTVSLCRCVLTFNTHWSGFVCSQ